MIKIILYGILFFHIFCSFSVLNSQSKGGRWEFENNGNDTATWDLLENNGVLQNQAGFSSMPPLQQGNAYLWLDSSDVYDFFKIENSDDLDFDNENIGISAWIYPLKPTSSISVIDNEIVWPNGVDVDGNGYVYIGSAEDNVVYKIAPDGSKSVFVSVPISGELKFGNGGYLYVCEQDENKIVRVSPDGSSIEDVVSVPAPVSFDWETNGNMYIVENQVGIHRFDTGGSLVYMTDLPDIKTCRIFENYLYATTPWEGKLSRFEITNNGLGNEEVVLAADSPVGLEIDSEGTLYYTLAWDKSLYAIYPDSVEEVLFEDDLMMPMRYITLHGNAMYIVFPGFGDTGKTIKVNILNDVHYLVNKGVQNTIPKTTNYSLRISMSNNLEFLIRDANNQAQKVASSFTIPENQWSFVAAFYEYAAAKVYMWNEPTAQPVDTLNFNQDFFSNNDPLSIGAWTRYDPANPSIRDFEGRMDDVRISGRVGDIIPGPAEITNTAEQFIKTFVLHQNYPNPFNPSTVIPFDIPELEAVRLRIYDISGRHIKTLLDEPLFPGHYTQKFNASQLASGLYFYRLEMREKTLTRKMLLLR